MADIITLHPEKEHSVKLTGTEWMAVLLRLSSPDRVLSAAHRAALETAEPKMLQQLKGEG